jgi:hypothetical protein
MTTSRFNERCQIFADQGSLRNKEMLPLQRLERAYRQRQSPDDRKQHPLCRREGGVFREQRHERGRYLQNGRASLLAVVRAVPAARSAHVLQDARAVQAARRESVHLRREQSGHEDRPRRTPGRHDSSARLLPRRVNGRQVDVPRHRLARRRLDVRLLREGGPSTDCVPSTCPPSSS